MRFDGERVYASLLQHRDLWLAVLLDRPGIANYAEPTSLLMSGLIKLRDLPDDCWNADTLYILTTSHTQAEELARIAHDEDWAEKSPSFGTRTRSIEHSGRVVNAMGCSRSGGIDSMAFCAQSPDRLLGQRLGGWVSEKKLELIPAGLPGVAHTQIGGPARRDESGDSMMGTLMMAKTADACLHWRREGRTPVTVLRDREKAPNEPNLFRRNSLRQKPLNQNRPGLRSTNEANLAV